MNMRGATISPRCDRPRSTTLSDSLSAPTSRTLVMPFASQILWLYSNPPIDCPLRCDCMCACALISPGSTYLPVASISASAAGRLARPARSATGSSETISVITLPSTMMSIGPRVGVPLPSITSALRIARRFTRCPCVTPVVGLACAVSVLATSASRTSGRTRESGIKAFRDGRVLVTRLTMLLKTQLCQRPLTNDIFTCHTAHSYAHLTHAES